MKLILKPILAILLIATTSLVQVPEKAAPFTAVKWQGTLAIIKLADEWYELKKIDNTTTEKIVEYCKKNYGEKWKKRFSEDLVEVFNGMGIPLKNKVNLSLMKNNSPLEKLVELTKENRQAVLKFNLENKPSETTTTTTPTTLTQPNATIALQQKPGQFAIQACKITYEYTGIISGTDIFYFEDYGKIAVIEQNRKEFGGTKKTIIWKDGKSTFIDHAKKTFTTSPFRPKDTEPPTIAIVSKEQIEKEGYKKLDNETIAEKNCEVYEHQKMKVKYWLWNSIDLKLENYSLGKTGYVKKAIKVEVITKIPTELVTIPVNYSKK